jgi:hypothetical protein
MLLYIMQPVGGCANSVMVISHGDVGLRLATRLALQTDMDVVFATDIGNYDDLPVTEAFGAAESFVQDSDLAAEQEGFKNGIPAELAVRSHRQQQAMDGCKFLETSSGLPDEDEDGLPQASPPLTPTVGREESDDGIIPLTPSTASPPPAGPDPKSPKSPAVSPAAGETKKRPRAPTTPPAPKPPAAADPPVPSPPPTTSSSSASGASTEQPAKKARAAGLPKPSQINKAAQLALSLLMPTTTSDPVKKGSPQLKNHLATILATAKKGRPPKT